MHWYMRAISNYANFTGRARRREYWWFFFVSFWILVILSTIGRALDLDGLLALLFSLMMLTPALALHLRRLHDTGRSGWWLTIIFVPGVGGIVLFLFMVLDSQNGQNRYGPRPK